MSMPKWWIFFLTFFIFLLYDTIAQEKIIIDSLKASLNGRTGAGRFLPLYDLSFEYIDKDNKQALQFIQQAEQVALLAGDSLWIVKSKRVKGQILAKLQRSSESIPIFRSVLEIAERNKFRRESMMISNTLGVTYLYHGQFDVALQHLFLALELARRLGSSEYTTMCLNNIGTIYYRLTDYNKALKYLHQSIGSSATADSDYGPFLNMSLCYNQLGDFSNAKFYLDRSIEVCGSHCTERSLMHIKLASGLLYQNSKQLSRAEDDFRISYDYAKRIEEPRMVLENIYFLSGFYLQENRISAAEDLLREGEHLIERHTFPDCALDIYSRFSELYIKKQDFKQASTYQAKYIQLKNDIYNSDLTIRLMTMESESLERENILKITEQEEIILLKEEIIDRQKALNAALIFLGLITFTFAVFLYRNFQRKKNLNDLLEARVKRRTRELELNRQELEKVINQKDLHASRIMDKDLELIGTLTGLCLTGTKETEDPVA